MTPIATSSPGSQALPDHTQLPESDGRIVENYQEHPQGSLLTESAWPVLERLYPNGQFSVGHDSGIYWRITELPLDGCKSPDWFLVPGVPPMLRGQARRSYVLWQEHVPPLVVMEFVSGDGTEERDGTPETGKFWVYERGIQARYYVIYERDARRVEVYHLVGGRYQPLVPNERGHFLIPELNLELGLWQGRYKNMDLPWLRWFDADGRMLPHIEDIRRDVEQTHRLAEQERRDKEEAQRRAEQERRDKEQAQRLAEQERHDREQAQRRAEQEQRDKEQERRDKEEAQRRAELLAERLRALGINPDEI
jgi:Uma2 family endonuclease